MDEILTMSEIEAKFDSEWVLIENPRTDEALTVRGGTVRWHGKDREEVYRRAVEIRPNDLRSSIQARCPRIRRLSCEFLPTAKPRSTYRRAALLRAFY